MDPINGRRRRQSARTRNGSVARHGGVVLLARQVVGQEAAAARQTAGTLGDVAVATATTMRLLLRQQQTPVLTAPRHVTVTVTCQYIHVQRAHTSQKRNKQPTSAGKYSSSQLFGIILPRLQ